MKLGNGTDQDTRKDIGRSPSHREGLPTINRLPFRAVTFLLAIILVKTPPTTTTTTTTTSTTTSSTTTSSTSGIKTRHAGFVDVEWRTEDEGMNLPHQPQHQKYEGSLKLSHPHRHLAQPHQKPQFRHTVQNVSVSLGERACLKCRVDNLGSNVVIWRKLGEAHPLSIGLHVFVTDNRLSVEYNHRIREWSLVIHDVKLSDDGTYHCRINSKTDQHNIFPVYLYVKAIQVMGSASVVLGSEVRLICKASGRILPPRDIAWYKDGKFIESFSNGNAMITKKVESRMLISGLVIPVSRHQDEGLYQCRSTGNDLATMFVNISKGHSAEKMISSDCRGTVVLSGSSVLVVIFVIGFDSSSRC